jgi:DNA invertase Pin-like site-specific DNA recombinase
LALTGELEQLGVDFISLDDGLDTSTSVGRLFFQIRGAFAEYERRLISERAAAGREVARRRGVRFGRPSTLSAESVARLERLHHSGRSQRQIAKLLGVSKDVVYREITRARFARPAAKVPDPIPAVTVWKSAFR